MKQASLSERSGLGNPSKQKVRTTLIKNFKMINGTH